MINLKITTTATFLILLLLLVNGSRSSFEEQLQKSGRRLRTGGDSGNPTNDPFIGVGFGPGNGFGIPGMGSNGWDNGIYGGGYGGGYSGPGGGNNRNGVYRSSVTCTIPGPCYKKQLVCPAKCFKAYSASGKNYGGGGGGGGCTMDCKKKCVAYC